MYVFPERGALSSCSQGLRLLKIKLRIAFYKWLTYSAHCALNSQLCRMSIAKVRALIRKKCNPENWHGDVWKDMDDAGDVEP